MGKSTIKPDPAGRSHQQGDRAKSSSDSAKDSSSSRWTFLTNHAHVLILLNSESDIVLREVAARIGITERAVQRIVQDLKEAGFIKMERVGRKNRYKVLKNKPLRHSIEAHRKIGELLKLIESN